MTGDGLGGCWGKSTTPGDILLNNAGILDGMYLVYPSKVCNLESDSLIIDSKELDMISNSNNDTTIISNNDTMVTSNNYLNLGFDFGLVVGIVIGVAIGISLLFIYRQKNT